MAQYVDLHAHYLPALDDGASDGTISIRMIAALRALGFVHLCATPHQRAGMFLPSRAAIDGAFAAIRAQVAPRAPELELALAAENFWDDVFHERLTKGGLPCYPGGKAFLFEVNPQIMPPHLEASLFRIRLDGPLPVMAHPERYSAIQTDLGRAERLAQTAAMVVDLGALDGAHGRAEMKTARKLLEQGIAHAVTSDMHTPEDQRPVAAGMAWIKKQLGPAALERLLTENPRRILAGELP